MQATSLCSLVLLSGPPAVNSLQRSAPFVSHKLTHKSFISASQRDAYGHHYDGGKMVDENMILLRIRIREIEMAEMKTKAPSDWTEWEKKYFANYGSDVCDAVGMLQRWLMNTRPGLAVGMLALIMLSMSMSMSLVVFHLVEFTKEIM